MKLGWCNFVDYFPPSRLGLTTGLLLYARWVNRSITGGPGCKSRFTMSYNVTPPGALHTYTLVDRQLRYITHLPRLSTNPAIRSSVRSVASSRRYGHGAACPVAGKVLCHSFLLLWRVICIHELAVCPILLYLTWQTGPRDVERL
jgi:hypothetical protein